MTDTPKILAFAGSTRTDSFNKKLVKIAAQGARAAGAEATFIDLRDFAMPLFDEDLEANEGLPRGARQFKDLLLAHDGLLIASPEYNSSLTAVLKNAIDWASRSAPGEASLGCFVGSCLTHEYLSWCVGWFTRPGASTIDFGQYQSHCAARPDCSAKSLRGVRL